MINFKKIIKTNHIERKDFSYSKGAVQLNFSLRTDIKGEMKDFRDCLEKAISDIDDVLKSK